MSEIIDEQFFPTTFAQSFVRIYKTMWNIVGLSGILRYFCARKNFTKRVKVQWLHSDGREDSDRPKSLRFSIRSTRMEKVYYGEILRYFPTTPMSAEDMLLVLLIVIHANFTFVEEGGPIVRTVEKSSVTWVQDLGLDPRANNGLVADLVKRGLPTISEVRLESIILPCSECKGIQTMDRFRARQRAKGQDRKCVVCERRQGKRNTLRGPLHEEKNSQSLMCRFYGVVQDAILDTYYLAVNMSSILPIMDPPLVKAETADRALSSLAYYVPSGCCDIFVENGNDQPVEAKALTLYRRSDGRNSYGPFLRSCGGDVDEDHGLLKEMSMMSGHRKCLGYMKTWNVNVPTNCHHTKKTVPAFATSGNHASYWSLWMVVIFTGLARRPLCHPITYMIQTYQQVVYCRKFDMHAVD